LDTFSRDLKNGPNKPSIWLQWIVEPVLRRCFRQSHQSQRSFEKNIQKKAEANQWIHYWNKKWQRLGFGFDEQSRVWLTRHLSVSCTEMTTGPSSSATRQVERASLSRMWGQGLPANLHSQLRIGQFGDAENRKGREWPTMVDCISQTWDDSHASVALVYPLEFVKGCKHTLAALLLAFQGTKHTRLIRKEKTWENKERSSGSTPAKATGSFSVNPARTFLFTFRPFRETATNRWTKVRQWNLRLPRVQRASKPRTLRLFDPTRSSSDRRTNYGQNQFPEVAKRNEKKSKKWRRRGAPRENSQRLRPRPNRKRAPRASSCHKNRMRWGHLEGAKLRCDLKSLRNRDAQTLCLEE